MRSFRWILLLTLTVLLSFWKIVFTKQYSVLWLWELVHQAYAWYSFAAVHVQQGIVPLWDPYRFAGTPFNGEMQAGFFYPFKLLLYLAPLDDRGILSERAFHLFFVFSHWLAALFMFFLARRLKLSEWAALAAAVCFGLGGFVQQVSWPNILDAAAWLPLIVLFLLRAFEGERVLNAAFAGIALGMTFLAGSLHIAMMDAIVIVTFAAYFGFVSSGRRGVLRSVAIAAVAIMIGALIGAVQILPSAEYGSLAYRWVGDESPIRSFQKVPYPVMSDEANFSPRSLFSFVFRGAESGNHEFTNYIGFLPLVLAISGAWLNRKNPIVRYLSVLAIAAYMYSWGGFSFLHGVLYLIPFLDMAREPGRFIYLTHFAMALLAGYGAHAVLERRSFAGIITVLKWMVIVFAVVLGAASLGLRDRIDDSTYLSFFFIAASFATLVYARHARSLQTLAGAMLLLIAWDLYSFNWTLRSKMETARSGEDAFQNLLNDHALADYLKSQGEFARVHFDAPQSPNIGSAYGVPVTWAMSATMLVDYFGLSHPRRNELLNVRYTVRRKDGADEGAVVYSDKTWRVYENSDALPRAWIVREVIVDGSEHGPAERLMETTFDLKRTATIDRPIAVALANGVAEPGDIIKWNSYTPNRLDLEISAQGAGLLVLSEAYYPGWTAEVDGQPAEIFRANGFLRGVVVPTGTHRVAMRYMPWSILLGALVSIVTFLSICVGAIVASRRAKEGVK